MRNRPLLGAVLLLVLLVGCDEERTRDAQAPAVQAPPAAETWTRTECYFGTNLPDGAHLAAADWQAFLDGEITPRFRDGLTVLDAYGQYLNKEGKLVREPSKVLIVFHPAGAEAEAKVRAIAEAYKQRFKQESVLVARSPASVSF